ncbi:MAG: N-acetyltransferase [Alphaproteobacteria bacterium]|nr:MAG: N-acetyltransferase [Alphaproteobacteria bacterium]
MNCLIRKERSDDTASIQNLVAAAFGQPEEAELVGKLRRDGDLCLSLIAEQGGQIIGHIALSRLKSPAKAVALAPVSVHPEQQGLGIGGKLINEAISHALEDGETLIFVLGDPGYYTRFGFTTGAAEPFDCIYAGPYFMAKPLTASATAPAPVIYPDAFEGLE